MSLKSAIRSGVRAAVSSVEELMNVVTWTFVSTAMGDYDPLLDTYGSTTATETVRVLFYSDVDDDNQVMFSSRGNFVESPSQLDVVRVLLTQDEAKGRVPSVRDRFVDHEGSAWTISTLERVPGDFVWIMRAIRV